MTFSLLAQQTYGEGVLNHFAERFASIEGIGVLVAALIVAAAVMSVDAAKWAVLAVAIYVSTYSIRRFETLQQLPGGFQQLGEWSQAIAFGAVGLLGIAVLRPTEWRRDKLLHPAVYALFALQMVMSVRQAVGGFPQKGLAGIVVYTVMLGVLGSGIGRWLYDERHVRSLMRAVSWAAGLLVGGSILLVAVNYGAGFAGPRFMGTTANPQRLGAMIGMTLPFSLSLVVDKRSPPYTRVTHAAIAAFAILMVLASGSRTGFLLILIGTIVFFRTRLGPALLAAVAVGAFAVAGYILFLGDAVDDAGAMVIRTNNSRTEVWDRLWDQFMDSPLVGTAMESVPGESSYLSALAMTGLVGFVPLVILVGLLGTAAVKVVRRRRALGPLALFGDVAAASVAQMLAAWVFEAFALGTVTDHMLIVYCTLALLGLLRERLAAPAGPAGLPDVTLADAEAEEALADHHPTPI
jgi:O-antigen ligase